MCAPISSTCVSAERRTFKANYYAIQYLYRYTVSRDWALFAKKDPSAELRQLWKTHKNSRWLFPTRAAKIELSGLIIYSDHSSFSLAIRRL